MLESKESIIASGRHSFSDMLLKSYTDSYDEIISLARSECYHPPTVKPKRGRAAKGFEANLIDRLDAFRDSVCLFAADFTVPFTNNTAEQTMRGVKPKIKSIGCFRTQQGATEYVGIKSVLNTAQKHRINAVEAIRMILSGQYDIIVKGS